MMKSHWFGCVDVNCFICLTLFVGKGSKQALMNKISLVWLCRCKLFYMFVGKGSKQALMNNDEISLVLPKNKGFTVFFETVLK